MDGDANRRKMEKNGLINANNGLNLYIISSVLVYAELFILPFLLFPRVYDIIPREQLAEFVIPSTDMVFFLVIFSAFLVRETGIVVRSAPYKTFLFLHILILAGFGLYLAHVVRVYPFQPMGEDHILVKLFHFFNKTVTYLTIRYRIGYYLLAVLGHFTLFLVLVRVRRAWLKYLFAAAAAFFWGEFTDIFVFMGSFLTSLTAKLEYALFSLSGWHPFIVCSTGVDPIVGTDLYRVTVNYGCSGLNGTALFGVAYTMTVLSLWDRLNKIRAAVAAVLGVIFIYMVNLLRIYIIIMIGHFTGSRYAADCFHKWGGTVMYLIAVVLFIMMVRRWLLRHPKVS